MLLLSYLMTRVQLISLESSDLFQLKLQEALRKREKFTKEHEEVSFPHRYPNIA